MVKCVEINMLIDRHPIDLLGSRRLRAHFQRKLGRPPVVHPFYLRVIVVMLRVRLRAPSSASPDLSFKTVGLWPRQFRLTKCYAHGVPKPENVAITIALASRMNDS